MPAREIGSAASSPPCAIRVDIAASEGDSPIADMDSATGEATAASDVEPLELHGATTHLESTPFVEAIEDCSPCAARPD